MPHNHARLRLLTILLISCIVTAACASKSSPAPQGISQYDLKGRVESIDFDKQRITIAHEKIEGYMDAMTMPFAVKDPKIMQDLKAGDRVDARLVVDHSRNVKWLEGVIVESKSK